MLLATRTKRRDARDVEPLATTGADAAMVGRELAANVEREMIRRIARHTRRLPAETRAWARHALAEAYAQTTTR